MPDPEDIKNVLDLLHEHHYARAMIEGNIVALVKIARGEGFKWREIGERLGMTAQGAHKRFAARIGENGDGKDG